MHAQVAALFDRVSTEHGRLDILVNNALVVHNTVAQRGPFWEKPLSMQAVLGVGLRSPYVASWYAAPLLVANGAGLVVNTSSFGARCIHARAYLWRRQGSRGQDSARHGPDFRPFVVAAISLWMGLLKTERTATAFEANKEAYQQLLAHAESTEFPGRVINALAGIRS